MKYALALLGFGALAGSARAECAATCLTSMPGAPMSCDDILEEWTVGDDADAWDGRIKPLTCQVLEELNCCDCSDCGCSGTTTTTTATTTTESLGCDLCFAYFFSGNSTEVVSNTDGLPGFQNQFFDPYNTWSALGEHQRVRGCNAAALNGVDCSNCGCECGVPPDDIDCVQSTVECGDCSVTECGRSGTISCVYNTTNEGAGLGERCAQDYTTPCSTAACPVITIPPTTTENYNETLVLPNCSGIYLVDGVAVLDVTVTVDGEQIDLGGSCDSAAATLYCDVLESDYGVDCYSECLCVCDPVKICNSRALFPSSFWPSVDGNCYPATRCKDPCTEWVPVPSVPELNGTCEELLSTRTMDDLATDFEAYGYSNLCGEYKCCRQYADGGGIPEDSFGDPAYECYAPPTTLTTTTTTTTVTTTECDIPIVTDLGGQDWSANQLIERGLGCFEIANALGGIFNVGTGFTGAEKNLSNLTFYPDYPPFQNLFDIAQDCGCTDTCTISSTCAGCEALDITLAMAGFDVSNYFCEDFVTDFNMNCTKCGCRKPDDCDTKVLFSSGISANVNTELYDISCNQLSALGLNCYEIDSYTRFHGIEDACEFCDCDLTTEQPFCDRPCGGGQYGNPSSSGELNTSQLLSCTDLIAADMTCAETVAAGCSDCESCGCSDTTTTTVPVTTCDTNCNDLYLSCNELAAYFTCSELEQNSVFDGCGCDTDCGCVEAFTETQSCSSACLEGMSCDDWIATEMSDRFFYTCQNLEDSYGCDCSGCQCQSTSTTTTPPSDCATTTTCLDMDCETVAMTSGKSYYELEAELGCDCTGCDGCDPAGCKGYSCNDWQTFFGEDGAFVTCEALEEELDCACGGCDCATTSTTSTAEPGCLYTCGELEGEPYTCDDARAREDTMSCPYMKTFYGCNCTGCACAEVPDDVCPPIIL